MAKHLKLDKYLLVAMDFEADTHNKPLSDTFSDEEDLLSKVIAPILVVYPQELVDKGVEKVYIVSNGHYHPDGLDIKVGE